MGIVEAAGEQYVAEVQELQEMEARIYEAVGAQYSEEFHEFQEYEGMMLGKVECLQQQYAALEEHSHERIQELNGEINEARTYLAEELSEMKRSLAAAAAAHDIKVTNDKEKKLAALTYMGLESSKADMMKCFLVWSAEYQK